MTLPKEVEVNPYFAKPTQKEKEIYAEVFIALLEKIQEISGEKDEKLNRLINKIRKWRGENI